MRRLWGIGLLLSYSRWLFWWSSRHFCDFPRMKKFSIATVLSSSALFHHSENVFQNLDYGVVGKWLLKHSVILFFFLTVTDRMKPISIISFRDHVQQMHSEGDRGFESEYQVQQFIPHTCTDLWLTKVFLIATICFCVQSLGSEPTASHDAAKLASNGVKNRFTNIFPCKDSIFCMLFKCTPLFSLYKFNHTHYVHVWETGIIGASQRYPCLPPLPTRVLFNCDDQLIWHCNKKMHCL